MKTEKLRMVGLLEENVKRLKLVDLRFEAGKPVVLIGGRNAQGKSSLLDGIAMALGGQKLVPPEPIREGESSARVEVTLSNGLTIERRFGKGEGLRVTNAAGMKYPTPQAILDRLFGESGGRVLAFDPAEFINLDPKQQADVVKGLAGLDFRDLDAKRACAFDARTEANRAVRVAEGRLAACPKPSPGPVEDEIDIQATVQEINEAQAANAKRARAEDLARRANEDKRRAADEVTRLEMALSQAQERLRRCAADADAGNQEAVDLETVDLGPLQKRLTTAETHNNTMRGRRQWAALAEETRQAQSEADCLSREIAKIDAEKQEALRSARMPVEGLSLSDDGLALNGLPLAQASEAERLELAFRVAVALNPDFTLVLIRRGSVLDDTMLARICQFAFDNQAQVLIERVGDKDEAAIIIEDGEVRKWRGGVRRGDQGEGHGQATEGRGAGTSDEDAGPFRGQPREVLGATDERGEDRTDADGDQAPRDPP